MNRHEYQQRLEKMEEYADKLKGESAIPEAVSAEELLTSWLLSQQGQHNGFLTALVLCNTYPEYARALYNALPEEYRLTAQKALRIMVEFQRIAS